jgi:7,8-dihydroneopterin aldolase/epimerase/oxygenase
MSDKVVIERLSVYAYHGVHDEERRLGQRFVISLECRLDLRAAGRADDLRSTVCYAELADVLVRVATSRQFRIIEGLAEAIASEVLSVFQRVEEVVVRVEKPGAPVPVVLDGVAVEIRRRRDEASARPNRPPG